MRRVKFPPIFASVKISFSATTITDRPTCQISLQLSAVLGEVLKLHLRSLHEILWLAQREDTFLRAGVLKTSQGIKAFESRETTCQRPKTTKD